MSNSDLDKFYDNLWNHQKEAIQFINNEKICLLNLWCSTGKTHIIIYKILRDK